jgi:hypothetical protein
MPVDALIATPEKLESDCRLAPPIGTSSLLMQTLIDEK